MSRKGKTPKNTSAPQKTGEKRPAPRAAIAPARREKPAQRNRQANRRPSSRVKREGLLIILSRRLAELLKRLRIPSKNLLLGAFAVLLLAAAALAFYFSTYKNAYQINAGEKQAAIIKMTKKLDTKEIENQAILKIENELGTEILINEKIEFVPVHAKAEDISVPDEAIIKLSKALTYKVKAYVITVEGAPMAVLKSRLDADTVLNSIAEPYLKEEVKIVKQGFVEDVKTEEKYVEKDELITTDKALQMLTSTYKSARTYIIASGDNLTSIAAKAGMSFNELLALNPGYTAQTRLRIGDELSLSVDMPIISVRTEEEIKYTEVEKKPVQTLTNPNKDKTYRKSVQYGADGTAEVTEHLVRINGIETERIPIDRVIIEAAVPEIIEVGTR